MSAPAVRARPVPVACVLLALLVPPAALRANDEAPTPLVTGEGIVLPGGLWVAGDVTVDVEVPEHEPASAEINDVSLLARWEPAPRFSLFGELRLEDPVEIVEGEGWTSEDLVFAVERLWAEALVTPALTLRAGKTLTPFGLWNQIHRSPFTWTTEEPAVADDVFPTHATGIEILHRTTWRGWSVDAIAYGPVQDEIRLSAGTERGWLAGTRLVAGRTLGTAYGAIGLSAAGFRPYDRRTWKTAAGLDVELSAGSHQVSGELTFRIPAGGGRTVYGFYLQDAIALEPLTPIARNLFAVGRLELFQPRAGGAGVGGLVGLFWRPLPYLVLRADYLIGNHTTERIQPGFHASVALLF